MADNHGSTSSPSGGQLTLGALELHLWSAVELLRGSLDSSESKNYILAFLLLKWLSDRFEEESETIQQEGGDPEDPDEHQFFVPPLGRWSRLGKVATGLGEALNRAIFELEAVNPSLSGMLSEVDFNDERRLGNSRQRDVTLSRLVHYFSQVVLRNDNLSAPDILGRAYELLLVL
jgi:type I restriction enzyme M protein